jgi:hypothetical protein
MILIAGDSFSAVYDNKSEWWQFEDCKNISQKGSSEFKILKSLQKENLSKYEKIIVCHTSPYRIYTEDNIINNGDHTNGCYLINDLLHKKSDIKTAAKLYTKYFFNEEYVLWSYYKVMDEIKNLTSSIHISFFNVQNVISLRHIYEKNMGNICHMTPEGNKVVHEQISNIWM